eukprot:RCo051865
MAGYRAVWGATTTTTGSRISRLILCSLFLAPTSFSPPRGSYCIVKLAASGALLFDTFPPKTVRILPANALAASAPPHAHIRYFSGALSAFFSLPPAPPQISMVVVIILLL